MIFNEKPHLDGIAAQRGFSVVLSQRQLNRLLDHRMNRILSRIHPGAVFTSIKIFLLWKDRDRLVHHHFWQ